MIVLRQYRINRRDLRANPEALYIFGDNLERKGFGGQAAEMRGEPNAFGIATKRSISHNYPDDYFFDHQEDVGDIITNEFVQLRTHIMYSFYKAIIIPFDGIGTGLSEMPNYAPRALEYINKQLADLENLK